MMNPMGNNPAMMNPGMRMMPNQMNPAFMGINPNAMGMQSNQMRPNMMMSGMNP
jgi:hypothetical protein